MKRLVSLNLLLLLVLGVVGPAASQGPGLFVRVDCTTITTPVTGQTWCFDATAQLPKVWNGSAFVQAPATSTLVVRSYLAGLTLSTAGASTTMTTAAGSAADSTNVDMMALASSIAKTTVAWAVGTANGGLDTGTIANSTWYHFWLIKRTDTAVVDVLISLSATAPTMPTNYTERRRIGSGLTTGGGNWTAFTQDGDYFQWAVPVNDFNVAGGPGTAAVSRTLTVPTGVNVVWDGAIITGTSTAATAIHLLLTDLATTDTVPSVTLFTFRSPLNLYTGGEVLVRTNTSAQIRTRVDISDGNTSLIGATRGWWDARGRNN